MNSKKYRDLSDVDLLDLLANNNQLAFRQIYYKYWEGLYIYTNNILNDIWLTEDVLHEVFSQIWIRRANIQITNLKGYLYSASRNTALLKLRENKFSSFDEQAASKLKIRPDIEDDFDRLDTLMAIKLATKTLPKRCRTIFYMSKLHGYSSAEIANHFDISQRTVENQISLALRHIKKKLVLSLFILLSI